MTTYGEEGIKVRLDVASGLYEVDAPWGPLGIAWPTPDGWTARATGLSIEPGWIDLTGNLPTLDAAVQVIVAFDEGAHGPGGDPFAGLPS